MAQALLRGVDVRRPAGMAALALVAALAMTGWDMVMDPPMVAAGAWVWEQGGPYFGVPRQNYFGWVLNTFLIYLAFNATQRIGAKADEPPYRFGGVFAALPVAIYVLFAVEYLMPGRMPALTVVAVFSMLMPGLLALMRIGLPAASAKPV
ncbi:MAG: carotenoid biosynthesis protein [Caulobacteraceae bacterium]